MSKNITINGTNYNGISTIKALVQGSTTEYAEFVDASEISSDEKILTTKTITANGTYKASADGADGYSEVSVNVPTGGGSAGGDADFPLPHNNIQSGSFTPTENEATHSISLSFVPKGFICLMEDVESLPTGGSYAGTGWFYQANNAGGYSNSLRFNGVAGKALTNGNANLITVDGTTLTVSGAVISQESGKYFYAGKKYNWVAWDY